MLIPDVNLLVYAYDLTSPWHERAAKWWTGCLNGAEPVGLSWVVALGFVRLWTSPRVFASPMSIDLATGHIESWLDRKIVSLVNPGPQHAELVFGFLRAEGRGGNLTTDAHLAALALEYRATIHTADTDFLRLERAGVTSFASPIWAGIQALINKSTDSAWGRLTRAAPSLTLLPVTSMCLAPAVAQTASLVRADSSWPECF